MANTEDEDFDISRALGRVESSIQSLRDQGIAHQASDDRIFNELKNLISSQNDRIIKVEAIVDSVEGYGAAIADFETRLTNFEELRKIERTEHARDRQWIKWILWLVAALVSDHFTGSRVANFLGHLIR